MLWGVTLRSPHAAARIRSIDVSAALAAPGVTPCSPQRTSRGGRPSASRSADQPVLAGGRRPVRGRGGRARRRGAASSRHVRRLRLIAVEYEPLAARRDMEHALDPQARGCTTSATSCATSTSSAGTSSAADADVWVERLLRDGDAGSGRPRPRGRARRAGRRRRRRPLRRDPVAARRPPADRAVPRPARGAACG